MLCLFKTKFIFLLQDFYFIFSLNDEIFKQEKNDQKKKQDFFEVIYGQHSI